MRRVGLGLAFLFIFVEAGEPSWHCQWQHICVGAATDATSDNMRQVKENIAGKHFDACDICNTKSRQQKFAAKLARRGMCSGTFVSGKQDIKRLTQCDFRWLDCSVATGQKRRHGSERTSRKVSTTGSPGFPNSPAQHPKIHYKFHHPKSALAMPSLQ